MLVVWQGYSHSGFECHSPRIRSRDEKHAGWERIGSRTHGEPGHLGVGVQEGAMSLRDAGKEAWE